jgi:predicted AlkP superfamily phosphohydrolase/phosphomutase
LFENQAEQEVKFDVSELLESREYIVENLTKEKKNDEESLDVYGSQSAEVRLLAYKFLIENFNTKYSNLLPAQKKLLKEYITNISNSSKFTKFVNEEYKRVSVILKENLQTINSDIVKIKITEVVNQFSNKNVVGIVKENQLTSLLNAYELVEEIEKIKNEAPSKTQD